jgi:ketosteroid isomerase-like protein
MNDAGTMDPKQIFMQFVTAINGHDVPALAALMAPGHTFIDSAGNRTEGTALMEAAWRGYFAMCTDYWIRTDTVVSEGSIVLAEGQAGGSIHGTERANARRLEGSDS